MTDVDHMRPLEPDEVAEELNQKIQRLIELTEAGEHQTVAKHPTATITYYEPDQHKPGGRHITITDKARRVDTVKKVIELGKHRRGFEQGD